jgi:hypothetical protein
MAWPGLAPPGAPPPSSPGATAAYSPPPSPPPPPATSSQLFPASPELVVRFPPRDSIDAMDARGEDLSGAMRSRTGPA